MQSFQDFLSTFKFNFLRSLHILDNWVCVVHILFWVWEILSELEVKINFKKGINDHEVYSLTYFVSVNLLEQIVAKLK